MARQAAASATAGVPRWAWILMLVLGWNEIWSVLTNPVYLLLLVLVGAPLYFFLQLPQGACRRSSRAKAAPLNPLRLHYRRGAGYDPTHCTGPRGGGAGRFCYSDSAGASNSSSGTHAAGQECRPQEAESRVGCDALARRGDRSAWLGCPYTRHTHGRSVVSRGIDQRSGCS